MKSIKFNHAVLGTLLLGLFASTANGEVCRVETETWSFRTKTNVPSKSRLDFSDIDAASKIQIVLPDGHKYSATDKPLPVASYCFVNNPNEGLDGGSYAWMMPENNNDTANIFVTTKAANGELPSVLLTGLQPGRVYEFKFSILNPAASWGRCKPADNGQHIVLHTEMRNPYTGDKTGIDAKGSEYLNTRHYNDGMSWADNFQNNTDYHYYGTDCTSYQEIGNGKKITYTYRFATMDTLTSAQLFIEEFTGYGFMCDCSTIGLSDLSLTQKTCLGITSPSTIVCNGKIVTLTATPIAGVSKYSWFRKYKSEASFSKFTMDTEEPTVKDAPSDTAQYYVAADGIRSDTLTINVAEKCLYITPHYSSDLCSDDTNTLIASGYVVLDNIDSREFIWEEYDEEAKAWIQLESNTMKQRVKPEKTTKYRVTFGGEAVEYVHEVTPCASLVCEQLDSKTVFLETFGFFMDSVTYVDTKDVVRRGSVTTESSGDLKIERYWAPDPYDYVVYPSEYVQAINSYNNEAVVFDGENVMCGTNGHQYALLDPRNPNPASNSETRRKGGYTWCNNEHSPMGNYRIEDGFYALVRNPGEADCGNGDFWQAKDHTGNTNGAMLMVNCGPTKATIYSQKVNVGCSNLLLNFSAYVANAITDVAKDGTEKSITPVQVTFKIFDNNMNLLGSKDSDPIVCNGELSWTQQSMQLKSGEERDLYVQLVNNGESGYGNDILLDDISFSICLPKVVLITDGMDIDNPEIVHICNDTVINLYAKQKKEILENPLFRFQYKGEDGIWKDIDTTSTDYTSNHIAINSSDSRFWGEVEYRVVAAENLAVLEKVIAEKPLSSCDMYAMANSTLTIDNRYHGPMSPDEVISVCKGDEIQMKGSRECDKQGKWLTDWEWEWRDADDKVLTGYYRSTDLEKKTINYKVKEASEVFYFVGYDDVCSYKQKFTLTGKNVATIKANAALWAGCDSLLILRDSLTIESEGADPILKWTIDGNELPVFGDSLLIKPEVVPTSGVVRVDVDTTNMYCPLATPVEVPYHVNAGGSLKVSLSAGGINHLCLDPEKYDTIPLKAVVTPEASAADVKYYLWSVNGTPLDTTTTPDLIISTDPENKFHNLLVAGAQLHFEVRVADGVCFTVNNPSDPGDFYLEVNESYTLKLESYPNDSICLTDLPNDTVLVLKATATSISHPGNHDVQNNIKTYVWSVDNVVFARTTTPSYVILMSNHPSQLDAYLQAGTSPKFSVSAVDSICFTSESGAPSGEITIVFNTAYSMKVSPDGKTICVPEFALDENEILLELTVTTDPAAAQVHVQEYMWYLNDTYFRSTTQPSIKLSYLDLKDLVGQKVNFTVKSYDGICSTKNNPAENSNDVAIDIRSGGYTLSIEVGADKLCIDTLNPENNKLVLSTIVKPENAKSSIDKYYWMNNGFDLAVTTDTFCILTQASHPALFVAGTTAVFNVKTYDEVCAHDTVYGVGEGQKVYINESYKMELLADGDSLCYEDPNSAVLHLQAKVTPAPAENHIQKFRWYRDGVLFETTTEDHLEVTNAKYPGTLVPGPAHKFTVDSYDGICYSVDQPSESPAKEIVVGFKYDIKLEHAGRDSICLGTDSIVLKAVVTPEASKASVQMYIWSMQLNGVEKQIATTYAPEDSLVISQDRYPELFSAGTAPTFTVKSVDGICYTIDNPNESEKITIYFNTAYIMKMKASSEILCYSVEDGDNAELTLRAEVIPASASTYIQWYRWYKDGVLIDSTRTNSITITKSRYPEVLVPGIKPTFTVDSYDGFCFTAQDPSISDGVEVLINQKYDMELDIDGDALCAETDFILMRAKVNPAAAKANIQNYFWKVNGELFAKTNGDVDYIKFSSETYPELIERLRGTTPQFSVESVDGICYTVDNPAKSEPINIAIGGKFKITLEAPSDSMCFDGPSAVSLLLKASVEPSASSGLIKYYRWYKNGELIDSTQENQIVITEAKYPGVIVPGENPTFTVDAYDNVCYTSENPAKSAGVKIVINFKFDITLDNGGKDYLCVGTDSVVIRAVVTPAGSANNIQHYYWTKNGVVFDTTTVNYIVLSRENYPNLFEGSSIPNFGVLAVDGICYTDDDPATSSNISIKVNKVFDLKLVPNTDVICASGANSTLQLTAVVDPSESQDMIERYVWYKVNLPQGTSEMIGEPTVSPVKEVTNIAHGNYAFYVTAYDGVCFSVNPASSDSVNVSVHENIFVTLSADRLKYCTESSSASSNPVVLTAKVTQGVPSKYEIYESGSLLYGVTSSETTITFTVFPSAQYHEYEVLAYDEVCNPDSATAAKTGNPLEISVYDPIKFNVNVDKTLLCLGDAVHLSIDLIEGNPVQYEWSTVTQNGKEVSITTTKRDSIIEDVPTESGYQAYTVIASDGICDDQMVSISNVLVKENIEMTLRSDIDNVIIGGSVNFLADVTRGEPLLFTWKADDRVVATTTENTLLEFPKSPSVYTVEATDSVCSTVTSQLNMEVKLPTAFTPYDKDGFNDIFMEDFKVTIFNRFGQVIFEGNNGWDGSTYSNAANPDQVKRTCGAMADPGVYFYSVILKDGKESKGTIEVVKM